MVSVFHSWLFFKNIFLKEPCRIVLKETRIHQHSGRKRKVVVKKEEMMYIPLLEILQVLLNNLSILAQVKLFGNVVCANVQIFYCVGSKIPPEPFS